MLVGLLERLESVDSKDEPPYDEVEKELQRGWDEEAKEAGDVGKTLSDCVADYMEASDELKRKLNDKPHTAEERDRDREEREKRRRERRLERSGDGRHNVDLTIDTKKSATGPLPPTASPPFSANQPHSAWAGHSPYDSSPGTGRPQRSWPLQSLCECTGAVKAVLEFYAIAESPRVVKAVNALLLSCTVAELQSQSMQQRTVLWLSEHPTVSIPTSSYFSSPPAQSPLFALFPVACAFDTFALVSTDTCQRLRVTAADSGSVPPAEQVFESVLAEWTALDGERLQKRVEQLMKDRATIDLTTFLPPPATTLGGRTAKAVTSAATGTPAAKPAVPAVPTAPIRQAAAKSIVDSWMQLPSKPTQQPQTVLVRRPITTQATRRPPATAHKQPPPVVSVAAPSASSSLPEPSTMVALGKAGFGQRMPKKLSVAKDETTLPPASPRKSSDSSPAPSSLTLPTAAAAADELDAAANSLSIDASAFSSTAKSQPAAVAVKKLVPLNTTARKSVQEAKLLAKERAPITDDMLTMKAAATHSGGQRQSPKKGSGTSEVMADDEKQKTSKATSKLATESQRDSEAEVMEVEPSERPKEERSARKQKPKAERGEKAEDDENEVSLSEFMSGENKAKPFTADEPKEQSKPAPKKQRKKTEQVEKQQAESETEDEDDDEEVEDGAVEEQGDELKCELNEDGLYEVAEEVDYEEPPDDDIRRVYADATRRVEARITENVMARYYRHAPYRLKEKVQAEFHNRWYHPHSTSMHSH